jgi:hypothetical protein
MMGASWAFAAVAPIDNTATQHAASAVLWIISFFPLEISPAHHGAMASSGQQANWLWLRHVPCFFRFHKEHKPEKAPPMFHNETSQPNGDSLSSAIAAAIKGAGLVEAAVPAERRSEHRRRVLKTGRVIYHRSLGVMDATVRDVTSRGARIRVAETLRLPEICEFQFKDDKYRKTVRVVWRTATEAGIAFQ